MGWKSGRQYWLGEASCPGGGEEFARLSEVLRTHADDCAAFMQRAALTLHRTPAALDYRRELRIEGVREAHMTDQPFLEESEGAHALCPVDDLVGDDKVHRPDVLLQRAHCAECDDAPHANMTEGRDVGPGGNLVGCQLMVCTVPREEGDGHAIVLEDLEGRGGVAPWRERVDGRDGLVAVDL